MAKPKMLDLDTLIRAGINPKTGMPYKVIPSSALKEEIRKNLRIKDEQTAVNRYEWDSIPFELSSVEIERFVYYLGTLVAFKLENTYYLMPYALDGTIDFYGRFNRVHPIPFSNSDNAKRQAELLSSVKLDIIKSKDSPLIDSPMGVILNDYTPQRSESIIPRSTLIDAILDMEATMLPYMKTALMNSTGIVGVVAGDSDEVDDINEASGSIDSHAVSQKPWIPILRKLDRQDLTNSGVGKTEDFAMAMQTVENFRLSLYGLDNSGLFTKKEHTNDSEVALNATADFPLQDGLLQRQHFCDTFNKVFGTALSVKISDSAMTSRNDDVLSPDKGGDDNEPDKEY